MSNRSQLRKKLVKIYGHHSEEKWRYRPPGRIETGAKRVVGNPGPKHISTSFAERQNLIVKMSTRNQVHAIGFHFFIIISAGFIDLLE